MGKADKKKHESKSIQHLFPQKKKTVEFKHETKPSLTSDISSSQTTRQAHLDILRQFDLNLKYGPNIGLKRIERYHRAYKFHLNPPSQILDILELPKYAHDDEIQESCWTPMI